MATSRRRPAPRHITPEDLTRIVFPSQPQIAPDGSRVAFVHKKAGEKNAYLCTIWMASDGADPVQFTSGPSDQQPRFSPDGEQLAFVSNRTKPRSQIQIMSTSGGEARKLTDLPEGSIGDMKFSPDGSQIAFAFREVDPEWTDKAKKERQEKGLTDPPRVLDDWWYRLDGDGWFNAQRFMLYILDVKTGEHRVLYRKDQLGFFSFDWSPDGRELAITTNRAKKAMIQAWKDEILIINAKTGKSRPVAGLPDGPKSAVAWSPDGAYLAWAGREGRDGAYSTENLELWITPLNGGRSRSLTAASDYCLMAVTISDTSGASFAPNFAWTRDSRRLLMKIGTEGSSHLASVARRGGAVELHTTGSTEWDVGSLSTDGRHIALTKSTFTTLPEVHVGRFTRSGFETTALTRLNAPLLRELKLSKPTAHRVPTADGTKVHTWIMFPPGHKSTSRKRYPAVLEIHGGPHGQYGVGFFHEFQVLAAQGYAVVFSNPRGSKGYGRDHCHAIRGAWGTADWVDIQAVTEFMSNHASIDTKRMGAMGGSYGGYMTNWIIGHTRAFKAAITDRCVSNVVSMGGTSDFLNAPDQYFPGNFWDDTDARWEQSPMKHIGNCRTPTLIIHSEGDLRCNIEQSEQVFTALKLLNVPTRFVRYPRTTSHGMSRSGPVDMRLHRLHQIIDWWARYLRK